MRVFEMDGHSSPLGDLGRYRIETNRSKLETDTDFFACPDCGATGVTGFGQHHDGVRLLWSQSTRCTECDCSIEADDIGFPPDAIRRHLIASSGRWGLLVETSGPDRLKACKILHCDLETTLEEVKRMKDRMPGIVYTGTKCEIEWLRKRLQSFGFSALVIPCGHELNAVSIDLSTRLQRASV
ncbi:MAG: hypothetical protein AAFP69_15435 [Planctomycetota bacterium]